MSKEEKLAKRRAYEKTPEFRERWREYKAMHMRAYLIEHPDAYARNKERSLARYYENKAHSWLAQLWREPVAWQLV